MERGELAALAESFAGALGMQLVLSNPGLVVLIGPAGSGKSTFARRHFKPTEILSSDFFRAMVSDDEADQTASHDAFELLHLAASRRLARRLLTVIDATNVKSETRKRLLELAGRYRCPVAAIVFRLPVELCRTYSEQRTGRPIPLSVIEQHHARVEAAMGQLPQEGFHRVYILSSLQEVATALIQREPLPLDRRHDHGPFDIIGDVHGCFDELVALLVQLGYQMEPGADVALPPLGRKAVFVGDLVDRGPLVVRVLRLVMSTCRAGNALCVIGNHDDKLLRKLRGHPVQMTHGLPETMAQLEHEPELRQEVRSFLEGLPTHYLLDEGKLVVAHAGLPEQLHGSMSSRAHSFALYGDTTGEKDELGLPVRRLWAADYRGATRVVYGHTPVPQAEWCNNTINIDTGCVFGGRLTALRYPEEELVAVPAARVYCPPARPFLEETTGERGMSSQEAGR
jgi:protein phosphatase